MKNIFKSLSKNQLSLQGILLWLVALINFDSDSFWFFAISAIVIIGMQGILNEIRKLTSNGTE